MTGKLYREIIERTGTSDLIYLMRWQLNRYARTACFAASFLVLAGTCAGQSHPAWWTYASPEATALVGIQWSSLRSSPFAGAVSGELRPGGSLRFPNVPMLGSADQILLSSPALLGIEYGLFPADILRQQASAAGMTRRTYRDVPIFVSADPEILSIARVSDNLLLLGSPESLEDAIERGQYRAAVREAEPGSELDPEETPTSAQRPYTPLLAVAAKYSQEDLWAVSTEFPDPLASLFVPLDVRANKFEGSVSLWQGMHLVAGISAGSVPEAVDIMDYLRQSVSGIRPMARALELTIEDTTVLMRLDINEQELADSLGTPGQASPVTTSTQPASPDQNASGAAAASAQPVQAPGTPAQPGDQSPGQSNVQPSAPAQPDAAEPDNNAQAPERRVVRIVGLEEDTREIELPANQR